MEENVNQEDQIHNQFCQQVDLMTLIESDKKNVYTTTRLCLCDQAEEEYRRGYNQAVRDMSWQCQDCGNTYDPNIDECPNELLDEIVIWERATQRKIQQSQET